MKGVVATAALAAMATGANAHLNHRRAHDLFKKGQECKPVCTTYVNTIIGEPTFVPDAPKPKPTTSEAPPPPPVTTEIPVVPVPEVTVCETPGTYTIPEETIIVDKTVTVCAAASTHLPPGTHTYGEITTVVEGSTTVTCPYADATNGVEAPLTTHVCHEAGVCTVVPGHVTVVEEETDVYYPVPTTYAPGTYTAPATTVTVTVDQYVVYCPYTTSTPPAPEPTKEAPPPPPKVEEPKEEAPKEEAPKKEAPKDDYKPKAEKPKEEKKPKIGGGLTISGKLGEGDNDHYGITYTPYNPSNGDCMSGPEVEKDIVAIKAAGFTTLRIYSTDCNTLDTVGPACKKHDMKLIVGVFVKNGCSINSPDIKEQVDTIAKWGDWERVDLVVMGNESIMNGLCTANELKDLIVAAKSKFSDYNGPYTIAETLDIYERPEVPKALCSVIDVVGANVHAYFNPNVKAEEAGKFVKGQLDILGKMCPGKEAINLESGWPNGGKWNGDSCNGAACGSPSEQKKALDSIRKECGSRSVFFSFKNDEWKADDLDDVERHWGTAGYFTSSL